MAKRKRRTSDLPYREGTWFVVPLRCGGYVPGIVVRSNGNGCIFGYFFGPRHKRIPRLNEVQGLRHEDVAFSIQFGDLGLLEEHWPIIGESEQWESKAWPMPPFIHIDESSGKACLRYYSEHTLKFIKEEPCDISLASEYPEDGLAGYGFVEARLTKLLGEA